MKLLLAACLLFTLPTVYTQCLPYPSLNVSSSNVGTTVNGPTTNGKPTGTACPLTASTTITFTGDFPGTTLPAGARITILTCNGLNANNTVFLHANNQTFDSCPAITQLPDITWTNVFQFDFKFTGIATVFFNLKTIAQQTPTTVTFPPSPTTPYDTSTFPYNPATARMDLTIGLDVSTANAPFLDKSKQMATDLVNYFTYNNDTGVRLSLITFDPQAKSGWGTNPLWSMDKTGFVSYMDYVVANYAGSNSLYATVLNNFYFGDFGIYPLRNNTQRVFIILTGVDASGAVTEDFAKVKTYINSNDVKFILVNMNTAISLQTTGAYDNLKKLSGDGPNAANLYDYQAGLSNNAQTLLKTIYFDGNKMCNLANQDKIPLTISGSPPTYGIPLTSPAALSTNQYCNYIRNSQTYFNTDITQTVRVNIWAYDVNPGNDFIKTSVDGTQIGSLTGLYGSAFYCLQGTNVTVAFESNAGLVYTGYQSIVKLEPSFPACRTSGIGTFIEI